MKSVGRQISKVLFLLLLSLTTLSCGKSETTQAAARVTSFSNLKSFDDAKSLLKGSVWTSEKSLAFSSSFVIILRFSDDGHKAFWIYGLKNRLKEGIQELRSKESLYRDLEFIRTDRHVQLKSVWMVNGTKSYFDPAGDFDTYTLLFENGKNIIELTIPAGSGEITIKLEQFQ